MKKKKISEKYNGQWVLLDDKNNVIYASDYAGDVVREGKNYPAGEVSIEKKMESELCFF